MARMKIPRVYNGKIVEKGWHTWLFKITFPHKGEIKIRARTLSEAVRKFKKKHKNVSYRVTEVK